MTVPVDLQAIMRQVDEGVVLVPGRILRRVIKRHRKLGGLGLQVPHRKSYNIARDTLLEIASRSELGIPPDRSLPEIVLLLPQPLAKWSEQRLLLAYWRLLFHSQLHREFDRLRPGWSDGDIRRRIADLGRVEFDEARAVLAQENLVFDPENLAAVWEEFAVVYLELHHFDPRRCRQFFPAILDHPRVLALLQKDIDSARVLADTRLPGAPDPGYADPPEPVKERPPQVSERAAHVLLGEAEEACNKGNLVRAALKWHEAIRRVPAPQRGGLMARAKEDIGRLVDRLQVALGFDVQEKPVWVDGLNELLPVASQGFWPVEARLLFDLQTVCIDNERELFAVDLVECLRTWFTRPLKRPLPDQPLVLTVKHLRSALARLTVARMPDTLRNPLLQAMQRALHEAEGRTRDRLRPRIHAALAGVGLVPLNAGEALSRDKVGEELLDHIVESGFLRLGDVRDALARSRLKLPDLTIGQLVLGDPLLKLNRRLAVDLDGIYHRGETYLCWLQRFSSLFFGTIPGRWLTLYLILPFLGSFFVLMFIDVMSEELHKLFGLPEVRTLYWETFIPLAVFLVPLLHVPPFRRGVWRVMVAMWRGTRTILYDWPLAMLQVPFVKRILQSRVYLLVYQYLIKPMLWAVPVGVILWLAGVSWELIFSISAMVLIVASVLFNSRLGLVVEEAFADWLVRSWKFLGEDLLPGLVRWIIYLSQQFLEGFDRIVYTADEWLRFRGGDSHLSFIVKVILGTIWFVITYIARFVVNLLIEPQVNPIKHFPVVTVSHKLMLMTVGPIAKWLAPQIGWGVKKTEGLVLGFIGLIPGVFGFLAWELKENWKLYRANESETIDPIMVGSHGEHVIHLMRPGFHSGTLPKLFVRLRREEGAAERKQEQSLHHVEESLHLFVKRELLAPLATTNRWAAGFRPHVHHLNLATNRVRVELSGGEDMMVLDLIHRDGLLLANVVQQGWVHGLDSSSRAVFDDTLVRFWALAGVDELATTTGTTPRDEVHWREWVGKWQCDQADRSGVRS